MGVRENNVSKGFWDEKESGKTRQSTKLQGGEHKVGKPLKKRVQIYIWCAVYNFTLYEKFFEKKEPKGLDWTIQIVHLGPQRWNQCCIFKRTSSAP
jgi:hypothetical protein